MPKASNKRKKAHPDLVLCRCKAHCLKQNKDTGKYEGAGEHITLKARATYRRDEQLLELLRSTEEGVVPQIPFEGGTLKGDKRDSQTLWEDIIGAHLKLLRDIPVFHAGVNTSLTFLNSPKENGGYEFKYIEDEDGCGSLAGSLPNTGTYSLTPSQSHNRHYVERENTLWEICRMLESFSESSSTRQLHGDAFHQLCELEREKAMQWASQCEEHPGGPYFNTGVSSLIN